MNRITGLFLSFIFAVSFIVVFSATGSAQVQTAYQFLEVVDTNQKPISDAKVTINKNSNVVIHNAPVTTDEKGRVRFDIQYPPVVGAYASVFTIEKKGYFPFYDFGLLTGYPSGRKATRIELFRIPKTKKQRKVLGKKQLKREFIFASQSGDTDSLRRLIEKGINPNLSTSDLEGFTNQTNIHAIKFTINLGYGDTLKLLLEKGADLPPESQYGNGLLFSYITSRRYLYDSEGLRIRADSKEFKESRSKYIEGLKSLFDAGVALNRTGRNGRIIGASTPLTEAVERYDLEATKILIEAGADINLANSRGETPLIIAASRDPEVLRIVLAAGVSTNQIDRALLVSLTRSKNVEILLKAGAKVNKRSKDGWTPLMIAVSGSADLDSIKLLLKAGADTNIAYSDNRYYYCSTPLLAAFKRDNRRLIKLILESGAKGGISCKNGETLLSAAIKQIVKIEYIQKLIELGADENDRSVYKAIAYIRSKEVSMSDMRQRVFDIEKLIGDTRKEKNN